MQINYTVKAIMSFLQIHPLRQRTKPVTNMEGIHGWLNTG
jgi:hypothetical protein